MASAQTWGSSSVTTAGPGSTSSVFEANSVFDEALAGIAPVVGLERIQSTGRITELVLGNGLVITEYLADFLVQARTEVLFSTCFWASSSSLALIHDALITLNERARQNAQRIIVRIMFSSYSFRQKFLSLKGTRIWKPNTWTKLGLPDPDKLDWLDMTVFSRFRKPFGVMHAKFLIVDRTTVLLPSSNISWENWYEIAIRLEGDIVQNFLSYFYHFYHPTGSTIPPCTIKASLFLPSVPFRKKYPALIYPLQSPILPLAFLPQGPSRRGSFPFTQIKSPTTLFQIRAITQAHTSIFIQTPNLTSRALIKALKQALLNQVHVTLYLPHNMMVAESIVTGWTTTACQIRLLQRWAKRRQVYLEVEWFKGGTEFVVEDKSHIKFMAVDEMCVVLGSSNLDRASACTSGEVNIAVENSEMAKKILEAVKHHQDTGKLSI